MLNFTVEEINDVIIVTFTGEIIIENAKSTETVFSEYASKGPRVIAFDCSDISFIDSSGLAIFVKFMSQSKEMNFQLVLIDLNKTVGNLFHNSRLLKFFTVMTRKEFEEAYL